MTYSIVTQRLRECVHCARDKVTWNLKQSVFIGGVRYCVDYICSSLLATRWINVFLYQRHEWGEWSGSFNIIRRLQQICSRGLAYTVYTYHDVIHGGCRISVSIRRCGSRGMKDAYTWKVTSSFEDGGTVIVKEQIDDCLAYTSLWTPATRSSFPPPVLFLGDIGSLSLRTGDDP